MLIFRTPTSFSEAYGLAIFLLRLSGIFPYGYSVSRKKFCVSWKLILLTIAHITVYTYVNITMLFDDWRDYAQPLIGHSSLAAFGNLVLRILGIIITFLVLGPVLVGSRSYIRAINVYITLMEKFALLGIDVVAIYRRVYLLGIAMTLTMAGLLAFSSWHTIFFYERITHREPTFKYYVVVVLSNYYKSMCLFYAWIQLFTIYMISKELNSFLMGLVHEQKEQFERESVAKLAWMSEGFCNFE